MYKNFKTFLRESSPIAGSKEPIFVLIIGGSASGKNYWYENNLKHMKLVDLDVFTKKLSGDPRKNVSKAIAMAGKELEESFKKNISVVQTGTGSNTKAVENKFKLAKKYGMKTALVLIDVDISKAIKQNEMRIKQGGHGDTLSPEKIARTNKAAKKTFNALKDNKELIDLAQRVKR